MAKMISNAHWVTIVHVPRFYTWYNMTDKIKWEVKKKKDQLFFVVIQFHTSPNNGSSLLSNHGNGRWPDCHVGNVGNEHDDDYQLTKINVNHPFVIDIDIIIIITTILDK